VIDEVFDMEAFTRWRLLEGLDDIGLSFRNGAKITAYETARPSHMPTG
jgi:3-isopropylmalate/(R)-2-methylmalate dehydratase small subunit